MKNKTLITTVMLCVFVCLGCSSQTPISEVSESSEIVETLPDADIRIPSVLVGEELSQAETDIAVTDNGDGTVTYSINGTVRADILNTLADDLAKSIETILADDDYYPNITAITPSDDYTKFTITLKDGQMNIYESMLVMSFYTVGNKYQIYSGVPSEEAVTTVTYINSSDNSIISESDSRSMDTFSS